MSELVYNVDRLGRPAWIALMVLGFIVFWPIGLALLAYLIWSGRLGSHWDSYRFRRSVRDKWAAARGGFDRRWDCGPQSSYGSSGSPAFESYREDVLKRLEEEEAQFRDYLGRLRSARDRAEFDQFMKERSARRDQPGESSGSVPNT